MPVGQMPVGGTTAFGPEHYTDTQCQGLAGENTRQNRDEGHTHPIPGQKSAGNRTRAAGLEGRDSTDESDTI